MDSRLRGNDGEFCGNDGEFCGNGGGDLCGNDGEFCGNGGEIFAGMAGTHSSFPGSCVGMHTWINVNSPQKLRFRPAEQAIASLIIHFVSLQSCPYAHALANRINGGVKNP